MIISALDANENLPVYILAHFLQTARGRASKSAQGESPTRYTHVYCAENLCPRGFAPIRQNRVKTRVKRVKSRMGLDGFAQKSDGKNGFSRLLLH
jgi:hypothetical protein